MRSQILEVNGSLISYYWQIWHAGFFCVGCEDFLLVYSITSFLKKELLSGGFPDQVGNWESAVLQLQACLCMALGKPREVPGTSVGCSFYSHIDFRA